MSQANEAVFSSPGPDKVYQEYLEKGEFRIQQCNSCNKHIYYPRTLCSHCGSNDMSWVEPSGNATVYAVSIVNRRVEKGGPYNVVLVDLDEGPRMMSKIEGVDHEAVNIGMKVKARLDSSGDKPIIVFDQV